MKKMGTRKITNKSRTDRSIAAIAAVLLGLSAGSVLSQNETRYQNLVDQYCVVCHNQQIVEADPSSVTDALSSQLRAVGLALDNLDIYDIPKAAGHWEKVVRKLRAGLMPPAGMPRPSEADLETFRQWLQSKLDEASFNNPDPGRKATFHRLNRAEYKNAIRDLLALDIEVGNFLPADDASYGFDNIGGILRIPQSLMERYLEASRTISRLAVGNPPPAPISQTFRTQQDEQQHARTIELPIGTRGGILVSHHFPVDADYDFSIQLSGMRGLIDTHRLEITVDGFPVETLEVGTSSTINLEIPVAAGPRDVAATFYGRPPALVEQVRERFQNPRTSGNSGGPLGSMPFVTSLTIEGPFEAKLQAVTECLSACQLRLTKS